MVTRIISGQSIRGLPLYNENKVAISEAKLIMASRFGTELDKLDFNAKLSRFEHLTFLKPNVKTNAIHIMLNFDKDDKLDLATFQQLATNYMERIGFGEQPETSPSQQMDTTKGTCLVHTTALRAIFRT